MNPELVKALSSNYMSAADVLAGSMETSEKRKPESVEEEIVLDDAVEVDEEEVGDDEDDEENVMNDEIAEKAEKEPLDEPTELANADEATPVTVENAARLAALETVKFESAASSSLEAFLSDDAKEEFWYLWQLICDKHDTGRVDADAAELLNDLLADSFADALPEDPALGPIIDRLTG